MSRPDRAGGPARHTWPAHDDPGLQPERTYLAWGRTLLSLAGVALLYLRWVPSHGLVAAVPTGVVCLAGIGLLSGRRRRQRRLVAAIAEGTTHPALGEVLTVAALVVALATVTVVVALR